MSNWCIFWQELKELLPQNFLLGDKESSINIFNLLSKAMLIKKIKIYEGVLLKESWS